METKMIEVKAPNDYGMQLVDNYSIFLAGSIEIGKATAWQEELYDELMVFKKVLLVNPRGNDWDISWVQDISNPLFATQVEWELNALDTVDMVIIYFEPGTLSPISLMELGYVAGRCDNVIACCPEGFWRRGNVQIMCDRFSIPLLNTKEEFFTTIKKTLKKFA